MDVIKKQIFTWKRKLVKINLTRNIPLTGIPPKSIKRSKDCRFLNVIFVYWSIHYYEVKNNKIVGAVSNYFIVLCESVLLFVRRKVDLNVLRFSLSYLSVVSSQSCTSIPFMLLVLALCNSPSHDMPNLIFVLLLYKEWTPIFSTLPDWNPIVQL